jgi:adenosine deaminase
VDVTRERLLALPKAELHVHLDGSVRPETMIELARERSRPLPAWKPEALERLMVASDTRSLAEYLTRFDVILSLLQDEEAIDRVAYELAEDCASENVRYLEVRFCPGLNTREGLTAPRVIEAALKGLKRGEEDFNLRTALIVCGLRHLEPRASALLAEVAIEFKGKGVVGFDLAGAESGHPPLEHRSAFQTAAQANMAVTIHAGEDQGPESIRQALHDCGAHRIGHGTRLFRDADLLRYVKDFRVPLEVCITSNVQTRSVASYEEHPVRSYYEEGLVITLNTDNRLVSGTTLTEEYWKAHERLGFSWAELQEVAVMGFRAAFLGWDEKLALLDQVRREMAALDAAG